MVGALNLNQEVLNRKILLQIERHLLGRVNVVIVLDFLQARVLQEARIEKICVLALRNLLEKKDVRSYLAFQDQLYLVDNVRIFR